HRITRNGRSRTIVGRAAFRLLPDEAGKHRVEAALGERRQLSHRFMPRLQSPGLYGVDVIDRGSYGKLGCGAEKSDDGDELGRATDAGCVPGLHCTLPASFRKDCPRPVCDLNEGQTDVESSDASPPQGCSGAPDPRYRCRTVYTILAAGSEHVPLDPEMREDLAGD